jgi:mannose-6-phosphate isomerase
MEGKITQPLVFEPLFMERVWGGRHLESLYGKRLPSAALIGESWEIVDRAEAQSVVHDGPLRGTTLHQLWTKHGREVFGDVADAPRFPILAKMLDAQENLSLQVHPPPGIASQLGGESKSELWYLVHAAPKARLYAGVKKGTTREQFASALEQGKVEKLLHAIELKAGDAIFLPSGRMHALGAGNVVVEIQENSDTTYRIYDWSRARKGRAAREVHIEEAMQCVNFDDVEPQLLQAEGEALVRNELFEIEKWDLEEDREVAAPGRFAIVACLTGELECAGRRFKPGDFFLVPADLEERMVRPIDGEGSVLRVTAPS